MPSAARWPGDWPAFPWPAGVRVVDFGIRGLDLAYALLDAPEAVILIDAAPRGAQPGTVYVIQPDLAQLAAAEPGESLLDAHTMNPLKVLRMVQGMGGELQQITLVGCEPADLGSPEEGKMGLRASRWPRPSSRRSSAWGRCWFPRFSNSLVAGARRWDCGRKK